MTTTGTSPIRAEHGQGATFVELFFDLVFVYAVTQLTATVIDDLTLSGVLKALLVLWLVWWSWTQWTWTLNLANTEHTWIRVPTLAATAVAFFLAQAVADAFDTAGAWFAVSYALVRLIGIAVQAWVVSADGTPLAVVARYGSISLLGIALVLVGGFAGPDLRAWLWFAAILADLFTVAVAGRGEWQLDVGHFAERHGLIVIIALGESLIAAGVATSELERDLVFAVAITGAVVATCALWWTYFGSILSRFEARLAEQDDINRGRFARDVFSLSHALIVAGVIGIAVAFEEAIAHPEEHLPAGPAAALTIGVFLFLGGLALAAWRAQVQDVVAPRLGVALLALASTPLVTRVPPGLVLWSLALVVVTMVVWESRRSPPRLTGG